MKISEKQLHVLVRVLEGSLKICDRADMNIFGFARDVRGKLLDEIINQQSNELIDVKDDEKEK